MLAQKLQEVREVQPRKLGTIWPGQPTSGVSPILWSAVKLQGSSLESCTKSEQAPLNAPDASQDAREATLLKLAAAIACNTGRN